MRGPGTGGQLGRPRSRCRRVIGQQEHARRGDGKGELGVESGERAVGIHRFAVQREQDRIERVLDGPRVASRGAGRHGCAFDQGDVRASLGEQGRRRAADDPAADDRHWLPHGPMLPGAHSPVSPGREHSIRNCKHVPVPATCGPTDRAHAVAAHAAQE